MLERELEHLVGHLGVQLGDLAAAEHVLAEAREPPDRLALGDEDPEVVIEQEHRGVRQVGRQGPVQRLGAADLQVGLLALARPRSVTSLAAKYMTPSSATAVHSSRR